MALFLNQLTLLKLTKIQILNNLITTNHTVFLRVRDVRVFFELRFGLDGFYFFRSYILSSLLGAMGAGLIGGTDEYR